MDWLQRYMSGFCAGHIPLHLLHQWQARFLCRDSDYFWEPVQCYRIIKMYGIIKQKVAQGLILWIYEYMYCSSINLSILFLFKNLHICHFYWFCHKIPLSSILKSRPPPLSSGPEIPKKSNKRNCEASVLFRLKTRKLKKEFREMERERLETWKGREGKKKKEKRERGKREREEDKKRYINKKEKEWGEEAKKFGERRKREATKRER